MSNDLEALARRAVACKRWRWMPGMRDQYGRRILAEHGTISGCGNPANDALGVVAATPANHPAFELQLLRAAALVPDFTDPATLGCLLALVREAWGTPADLCWMASPKLLRWWVTVPHPSGTGRRLAGQGLTEASALVAALEAAPAKVAP